MRRKRKSVGVLAFVVFAVLVVVGGYALDAAGRTDNPFDQIAFLGNWANGGEQRFEREFSAGTEGTSFDLPALQDAGAQTDDIDLAGLNTTSASSQFQLPPVSDLTASADATSDRGLRGSDAFDGRGGDTQSSISWSDFGDVLYNLWFVCATTAVFIVVQQVFKFIVRQYKRRSPSVAVAH